MEYQLVIKFWRKSLDSEAFLDTLEGKLKEPWELPRCPTVMTSAPRRSTCSC